MAVFFENVCKFGKCGRTFPTLSHLIIHIEDTHINYDALIPQNNVENTNIPLSYILKYQTTANDNILTEIKQEQETVLINNHHVMENTYIPPQYCFTTESELCESESSSDSIVTVDEIEVTAKKSGKNCPTNNKNKDKPFACTLPGCKKRYKNVNGLKYHLKNGHKIDSQPVKQHSCLCGKTFKSVQKLTAHTLACFEKHIIRAELTQRTVGPLNKMTFYRENTFYYAPNNNNNNTGDNVVVQNNEINLYEVP